MDAVWMTWCVGMSFSVFLSLRMHMTATYLDRIVGRKYSRTQRLIRLWFVRLLHQLFTIWCTSTLHQLGFYRCRLSAAVQWHCKQSIRPTNIFKGPHRWQCWEQRGEAAQQRCAQPFNAFNILKVAKIMNMRKWRNDSANCVQFANGTCKSSYL